MGSFRENNRPPRFDRGNRSGPRSFSGGGDRGGGRSFGGGGGRSFGGDRGGGRGSFDRRPTEMFDATCSNCGKACQVPFKPTGSKPVLCSDCFRKNDGPRGNFGGNSAPSNDTSAHEFKQINAKLDKILLMLENLEVVEEIEEDEEDADDEDEEEESDL